LASGGHFKPDERVALVRVLTPETRMIVILIDVAGLEVRKVFLEVLPAHEKSTIVCICPVALPFKRWCPHSGII
jgi:hypothetical protein